jgi:two-component system sensor histidine kinase/response regulator
VQESLETERRVYAQMTLEAWYDLVRSGIATGQRYDPRGILPAGDSMSVEMIQAIREDRAVPGRDDLGPTLALPLKVRGEVIGVLDAHKPAGASRWTEDEVALLQALVDQLGVALDSARLFQETQRRASREQAIRRITERMRSTVDIEAILQNTIAEVAQVLGVPRAYVRLGTESELLDAGARDAEGEPAPAGD